MGQIINNLSFSQPMQDLVVCAYKFSINVINITLMSVSYQSRTTFRLHAVVSEINEKVQKWEK